MYALLSEGFSSLTPRRGVIPSRWPARAHPAGRDARGKTYGGHAMGTTTRNDNHRVLDDTAATVAAFR
jgi:hypothetical protein